MKLTINFIAALCFCSVIRSSTHAFKPDIDDGEVVQIHTSKHRVRREVRSVTFELDEKDYHFNFEPSRRHVYSNDIPVWLVKSKPGSSPNYTYERVPNTELVLSNGHFYVDNAMKAVAFVHYDEKNRDIIYDGLFGENEDVHLITSLSESQKYKLQKLREERANNLRSRRVHHGIHNIQKRNRYVAATVEEIQRSKIFVNLLNEKLDKPLDVLYPKLLVLVDNRLFKYHNSDVAAIIKYVATFWNAVDQKYVELDSDVQLLVTGIIIADDENAFNYVNMGRLDEVLFGNDRYHIPYIFEHMRKYFHYNFSKDVDFQNYDAAVLMTALETRPIGGITYRGKICGDWYNGMVVRDEGWFDGVHTATHELAHALGAEHDSYNKSAECQSQDGNNGTSVMAPVGGGGDHYYWSECTKRYIREFRRVKAAECLTTRRRTRHFDENNDW